MKRVSPVGLLVGLALLVVVVGVARTPAPVGPRADQGPSSAPAGSVTPNGTNRPASLSSAPVQSERQSPSSGSPGLVPGPNAQQHTAVLEKSPPQRAQAVLQAIQKRDGEPPPGYVGGRIFENRERRLPPGVYREYDVYPKVAGRSRGAERIVIEQRTGKAYYSGDHYQTFIPMN